MELTDLAGAEVVLLGVGLETLSILPHLGLLDVAGIRVVESAVPKPHQLEQLRTVGITATSLLTEVPAGADVVLRSPGFPVHRSDVAALCAGARLATTPTGLWLAVRGGTATIAVTGTKGKSTTVSLIASGLSRLGLPATLVGNIGTPAWNVSPRVDGVVVAELSSYHGADLLATGEIAVLTMLTDDHLDWHGSAEAYRTDKLRVLTLPQPNGQPPVARFATSDQALPPEVANLVTRVVADGDYRHRNLALAVAAIRSECALRDMACPDPETLLTDLASDYPHLPSRFEPLGRVAGLEWIDDALGSNPSATAAALERLRPGPIALICGGHDRGVPLDPVVGELAHWPDRSVTVIWQGDREDHRFVELSRCAAVAQCVTVATIPQAVGVARDAVPSGSTVVFSPLAPTERSEGSWADRSRAFHETVRNLES